MIEEIKKEITDTKCVFGIKHFNSDNINDWEEIGKGISLIKLFEILDKYDNQSDYKSAWNELKEKTNEELKQATWSGAGLNDTKISMQELEQKYNLGGE